MASKDPEQAVQEIYELADSLSCRSADENPPPSYSASSSPPSYSSEEGECWTPNCTVAFIAIFLLAGSFNMLVLASHTIYKVRKIHPKSSLSGDPEWPIRVDCNFQIWMLGIASLTFIHGAVTLYSMCFSKVRKNPNLPGYQLLSYILFIFAYVFMFAFEDMGSKHPVIESDGIPVHWKLAFLRVDLRKYPTIISWTCMKKDNQGDSDIAYDSLCHASLAAKYLTIAMFVFYIVACIVLVSCCLSRYLRSRR